MGKSDEWLEKAEEYLKTARDNGKVHDVGTELINELRSHQTKLEMQKEELQTILDSSRSFIFYKDKENRFLQVNKAFAEILGLPQEQLEGKSLFDIFPKDQAEAYWKDDKEVMNSEKPKYDIIEPMPSKNKIRYVQTDKIPYRDANGNIIGIIGFAIDITERKKAEESLKESEERYHSLFQNNHAVMLLINPDTGDIVDANPAATNFYGYSQEELVKMKIGDINILKEEEIYNSMKKSKFSTEHNFIFKHRLASGEIRDVDVYSGTITVSGKKLLYSIIHDITERKQIENELNKTMQNLQRSNSELEQFAYVASHDLQEPLRMVSSFLQLLQRRYAGQLDSNADEFIEYAVDGAKRMQELIQDLLEYSRVTTKGKEFKEIKMEETIDKVLMDLKMSIDEHNVNITQDTMPIVTADDSQMIQLLQNLIGNAIKYRSEENPQIHISAEKEDKQWLFAVKDNGIGIDSKYTEKIFTIFQRLHSNDKYDGTGIGLAISKSIVERHGGNIWIESEPNKGSTFYFTIPETKKTI
jgi:PAS domain S-box-containing protein